jgi:hypothetical protein
MKLRKNEQRCRRTLSASVGVSVYSEDRDTSGQVYDPVRRSQADRSLSGDSVIDGR